MNFSDPIHVLFIIGISLNLAAALYFLYERLITEPQRKLSKQADSILNTQGWEPTYRHEAITKEISPS